MMKTKTGMILTVLPLAMSLTGCGGGGGGTANLGGGGSPPTPTPTLYELANLRMQSVTHTSTPSLGVANTSSSILVDSQAIGSTGYVQVIAPDVSQNFAVDTSSGGVFADIAIQGGTFRYGSESDTVQTGLSTTQQLKQVVMFSENLGWDYQTFGWWSKSTPTSTWYDPVMGAFSGGESTPAGSVPTTGSAIYTGYVVGRYGQGFPWVAGSSKAISATMSANVDFANRTVGVATTNTATTNVNAITGASTAASDLNMSGTLIYNAGSAQFTGNVTTPRGLNGSASGQFYGPAAQELGGTFGITGTINSLPEVIVGAFGAKR